MPVIPAQAGNQNAVLCEVIWIPACAGMTGMLCLGLKFFQLRGASKTQMKLNGRAGKRQCELVEIPADCPKGQSAGNVTSFAGGDLRFDFFDDFVADSLYFGQILNRFEIAVGGPVGNYGLSLCLANTVKRCQFIGIGSVDVDLGKGGRGQTKQKYQRQIQLFHRASIVLIDERYI